MRFGSAWALAATVLTLAISPNVMAVEGEVVASGNYHGNHYEVRRWFEPIDWNTANNECISYGGHLATIRAVGEDIFITNLLGWSLVAGSCEGAWIGLNDANSEGVWEWSNGEPLTYTAWSRFAPSHPNVTQNWVYMYCPHRNWGVWEDEQFNGRNRIDRFVCEYGHQRFIYYIPIAANLDGANDTKWMSDLQVKTEDETTHIRVELLKRGQSNFDPEYRDFVVGPTMSKRFVDILGAEFDFMGAAALRVTVRQGAAIISSSTYNNHADGPFGHGVPAVVDDQAFELGDVPTMIQLSENDQKRTNIGFLNASPEMLTLEADAYNSAGKYLGTTVVELDRYESQQINRIFAWLTNESVDDGYVTVRMTSLRGTYFVFSMVVDNDTGDVVYQYAQRGDPRVVLVD